MKEKNQHCEKCSYQSEEGLVVSGCAYCGCHFTLKTLGGGGRDLQIESQWKSGRIKSTPVVIK